METAFPRDRLYMDNLLSVVCIRINHLKIQKEKHPIHNFLCKQNERVKGTSPLQKHCHIVLDWFAIGNPYIIRILCGRVAALLSKILKTTKFLPRVLLEICVILP